MRHAKVKSNLKIMLLFLLCLFFLLTGCRKSLTVTFPPAGEQSAIGVNSQSKTNPNLIKANECNAQGDYVGALEYLEIALKEQKKTYGAGHPDVALILNNMGEAYFGLGQMETALDYYQQALAINLAALGVHNNTADTYANIGRVYSATGDFEQAMENLELGLGIDIQMHGEDSHEVAICYGDIAKVYENKGDFDKALEYYNKELEIEQRCSGANSKSVGITYNNMGLLYKNFQKYSEALECYKKARLIFEETIGVDHYYWGQVNHNMGNLYYRMEEYNNSIEYLEVALSVYEKNPTIHQYLLANAYNTLALDYYYLDDMEQSLQYELKAYRAISTYPYADAVEIQEYKDDLLRIYTDSGNAPGGFEQWLASQ